VAYSLKKLQGTTMAQ